MTKKYDALVLIGRFQPFHNAHLEIVRKATRLAHKIIIIVGSADQPRTYKNPWTAGERASMIYDEVIAIPEIAEHRVALSIDHNIDTIYNNQAWITRVQKIVYEGNSIPLDAKIGIIGHKKDSSTKYLDSFPGWGLEEVELIEPLSATDIRDLYFRRNCNLKYIQSVVPSKIYGSLKDNIESEIREQVIRSREFIETYKKQFSSLAYPPVFVTADSVVLCSGHVLLIKRRSEPGKGLWALPGGFLDTVNDQTMKDAAIRELREETGIKVPAPVLYGSITDDRVFDSPDRSARGRTITHAFKIELADGELPKVKGTDDALKAKWVPLSQVRSDEMFEDHYEIIQHFVGA